MCCCDSVPHLNSPSTRHINGIERSAGLWQPLVVVSIFLILALRLFRQVSRYAVNIFFSDQWEFNNGTLFEKHSLWEMFRWQHGTHRQGLGALLSYFLEPHFRWNSRGEAFLAAAIVTAAALCALYLKVRLWGPVRLFDIAIPLIFLTPAQFESLWITPNFAHGPLPLLLIVLYCVALTRERAVTRYVVVLIVNFLAIYTGFGLLIGFITPVWLILEYYSRNPARRPATLVFIPLALSLASLGSFFAAYNIEPSVDCFSLLPHAPVTYVTFFLGMLAHNFGARGSQIISLPLGAGALAAMIFVLASFGKRFKEAKSYTPESLVPAVLVAYCLLFCAATAYGRSCLGSHLAFESRYTNYLALGIFGLYLHSLRGQRAGKIFAGLLLAMLLTGSLKTSPADQYQMERFHEVKANWRSCYLRIEDVEQCDQAAGFWIYRFPEPTDLKDKLEYLKQTKQNLYSDSQ